MKKNLTHIERLRNDVLTSYDPYVRPVKNETDITFVTMSFVSHYISLVSVITNKIDSSQKLSFFCVCRTCTNLNLNSRERLN